MSWNGEERRRVDRQETSALCMAPISGAIKNLTGHGLGLESWEPLPIQQDLHLTIGQVGHQARLACRVIWCRLVRTESVQGGSVVSIYRSGVRFLRAEER